MATKRTYQPSKRRRVKKVGFRGRNKTAGGRSIHRAKRLKGRKKLTP